VGLQCNLLNAPPLIKLKKEHELTKHERRLGGGGANDGASANDGANDAATPVVVHQRYQESVAAAAAKAQASVLDAHHGTHANNDARARPLDVSRMSGDRGVAMTPRAARLLEDCMPSAPQEGMAPVPHAPPPRTPHAPRPQLLWTPSTNLTAGDRHGDRKEVSRRAGHGTGGSPGRRDPDDPDHDAAMSVVEKASYT
jgi:hypothetical protein